MCSVVALTQFGLLERDGPRMRVRKEWERSPFFLYGLNPDTGEEVGPGGTGFVVSWPSTIVPNGIHFYAVTCKHVIQDGFSIIRLLNDDGSTAPIEFDPAEWTFAPNDDLAFVDITERLLGVHNGTLHCIPKKLLLDEPFINRCNVGIGDQVVMMGLFADHTGEHGQSSVGRFGSLASMASETAPAKLHQHDPPRPAFLCDMRSRSGFSGSFVVVFRTPTTNLANISSDGDYKFEPKNNIFFRVMGIHRGQFRETVEARSVEAVNSVRLFKDGDMIEIASAMTYVVPIWRLTEALDSPAIQNTRNERDNDPKRVVTTSSGEELEKG